MTDHDLMIKAFGSSPVGFSPLTSGDDSQRLQVKLRIDAEFDEGDADGNVFASHYAMGLGKDVEFNPAIPDDDLRAMKEAIFLVAVEIGRAK